MNLQVGADFRRDSQGRFLLGDGSELSMSDVGFELVMALFWGGGGGGGVFELPNAAPGPEVKNKRFDRGLARLCGTFCARPVRAGPPARKKHSGGAALAETDPGSCTDFRVSHPDCVGVPGSLTNRRRAEDTAQSATVRAVEAIR
eukprot:s1575_g9.t1